VKARQPSLVEGRGDRDNGPGAIDPGAMPIEEGRRWGSKHFSRAWSPCHRVGVKACLIAHWAGARRQNGQGDAASGFDAHARPLTGLTSTNGHRPCRPEEGVLAGQAWRPANASEI